MTDNGGRTAGQKANGGNAADETVDKRIVVANGIDLDKRYFYEVTKRMSRDRDLRKLSLLGPPLWTILSLVGLVLAISGIISGTRTAFAVVTTINWTQPSAWIAVTILGGVVFVVFLFLFVRVFVYDIIDWRVVSQRLRNLRNIVRRDVWQNLNYWHPFTSHMSDRDPVVPLSSESQQAVSAIYSDGPHYQNVFVDALYITPDGKLSIPQKITLWLYRWDHRRRTIRRVLYAVALCALAVLLLEFLGLLEAPPLGTTASAAVLVLVVTSLVVVVATAVAINYPYLQVQFYSDSAGLSRYQQLLNDEKESYVSKGEDVGLSNSMSGYGLFYVSRFVASIFGRSQFTIQIDPNALAPTTDSEGSAFPAHGYESHPGPEHATAAAAELLWAALPKESVRNPTENADITLNLSGVDYYTITKESEPKKLVKPTAGQQTGFRLPVKKFMSVRDGFEADDLFIPEQPLKLLYDGDWTEAEQHTLYIGGGEHQQAINKLVLALKADGYKNIDVRENAFAVGSTPGLTRRLRQQLDQIKEEQGSQANVGDDDETASTTEDSIDNETTQLIHLPTEYFVSLVSGGNEFFRQDNNKHGNGFLLFRHEFDDNNGQPRNVHVLIGMSAVGTKTGALFWQQLVEHDFELSPLVATNSSPDDASGTVPESDETTSDGLPERLETDVVYFFDAPGPNDHPICQNENSEYEDIGELYTDTSWGEQGLVFEVDSIGKYQTTEKSVEKGGNKTLGTDYYSLKLVRTR